MGELLSTAITLLPGLLGPAVETALVLLAARWSGALASARRDRLAGALSLMAGVIAARFIFNWLPWLPEEPWDWLPYLMLLAAVAGLLDPGPPLGVLRWLVRLAVAALVAWLLVPVRADLESARPAWLVATGTVVFLLWSLLDPLTTRQPGALIPAMLALATGAAGVVLVGSANMKLAELTWALAGMLGACAVCSLSRTPRAYAHGMLPGIAVLLPGLLLNGYLNNYGDVPAAGFVLALAAPLGLWVRNLPSLRGARGFWPVLAQCAAVLIPAGLAAGLVMTTSAE